MPDSDVPLLAEVVGANAKRLRGDHKLEDIAKAARSNGLKWNSGRVSDLERGRISPTLPTLLALCDSLGRVINRPVALTDLLQSDGFIRLNDELAIRAEIVQGAVSGHPASWPVIRDIYGGVERLQDTFSTLDRLKREGGPPARIAKGGETEDRIARSLHISGIRMAVESGALWGRSFSEERDRRAGPDSNQQKRGRISRELKAELRERLAADGND